MGKPLSVDDIRKANPRMARMIEEADRKAQARSSRSPGSRLDLPTEGLGRGEAARPAPQQSKLELRFEQQLIVRGVRPWMRNYCFFAGRNWELDFSWPAEKIYVEVDGMAHRIKARFKGDYEKHAMALLSGWRGLRVCGDDIRHERAIEWTIRLLG